MEQPRQATTSREILKLWVRRMTMQRPLALFPQLLLWLTEQGWTPSCSAHLLSMWGDKRINICIAMAMSFAKSGFLASLGLIQQDACKSTSPHRNFLIKPKQTAGTSSFPPSKRYCRVLWLLGCQLTHLDTGAHSPVTADGTDPGIAAPPPSQQTFPAMSAQNIFLPTSTFHQRKKQQLYCFQGAPGGSP